MENRYYKNQIIIIEGALDKLREIEKRLLDEGSDDEFREVQERIIVMEDELYELYNK
jgi:hypothetical protein